MNIALRCIGMIFAFALSVLVFSNAALSGDITDDWETGGVNDPIRFTVPVLSKFVILLRDLGYPRETIQKSIRWDKNLNQFQLRREQQSLEELLEIPKFFNTSQPIYIDYGYNFMVPVRYDFNRELYRFCIMGITDAHYSSGVSEAVEHAESIDIRTNLAFRDISGDNGIFSTCEINKPARKNWVESNHLWTMTDSSVRGFNTREGLFFNVPMDASTAERIFNFSEEGGMLMTLIVCQIVELNFSINKSAAPTCSIDKIQTTPVGDVAPVIELKPGGVFHVRG